MVVNRPKSRKLHLGCGCKYFKGWVNADKFSRLADVKMDFEQRPWPFPSGYFDEVYSSHVLEHIGDVQGFMDELWSVCRKGAKVTVIVPHFSSLASASPFHVHAFNSQAMNYFTRGSGERYGKAVFRVVDTRIFWYPSTSREYVSFSAKRRVASLFGSFLDVLINANRGFFERVWCYWVGGAFEVRWVLEAVK